MTQFEQTYNNAIDALCKLREQLQFFHENAMGMQYQDLILCASDVAHKLKKNRKLEEHLCIQTQTKPVTDGE